MAIRSFTSLVAFLAITCCGMFPQTVQAGPLLDWLFGKHRNAPAYPVGPAVPVAAGYGAGYGGYAANYPGYNPAAAQGYAGNYGTYYSSQLPAIGPAGAGYTAPMPSGIAAATMPSTLSYVPNFQTQATRAPVTYYRPLLTTDPNTQTQVVALAPCTSYEYLTQRAPTFGRSALFGSNAAPVYQPPTQALPTYTLPSGGVPLAAGGPGFTSPYASGYPNYGNAGSTYGSGYRGSYSTLQPTAPSSIGPAGAYPTAPLGQTPYYGNTNGGSCGGFVPGLAAPPAPGGLAPSAIGPSSGYPGGVPSTPPTTMTPYSGAAPTTQIQPGDYPAPNSFPAPDGSLPPGYGPAPSPGGIFPPSSSDPASIPPQLPPASNFGSPTSAQSTELRPQLRSVTRHPSAQDQTAPTDTTRSDLRPITPSQRDLPMMMPIPAPKDFDATPRWNPGLLSEQDMTALRPITATEAETAGQATPIHWASFEKPLEKPFQKSQPREFRRPAASPSPAFEPQRQAPPAAPSATVQRKSNGWRPSR
jgi:hypothetical protein